MEQWLEQQARSAISQQTPEAHVGLCRPSRPAARTFASVRNATPKAVTPFAVIGDHQPRSRILC